MIHLSKNLLAALAKEAPKSGRQDIGIYVGDRESGPGPGYTSGNQDTDPDYVQKERRAQKNWRRYVFQVLKSTFISVQTGIEPTTDGL